MILSTMFKALRGRNRWLKTKRKYSIDKKQGTYVIMFPDSDREFNESALRHVDDFLNFRKGQSVIILTTDEWVPQNAKSFSDKITATELITKKDCDSFYSYYFWMYYHYVGFSEQFIIMSLQRCFGKRLALAEGVHRITQEDMSCLGLYIIRNWSGVKG